MKYKVMKVCKVIVGTAVSMALLVSQSVSDVRVLASDNVVNYYTLGDFVSCFPEHVDDYYTRSDNELIYNEDDLITWLDNYGWTDYSNSYADGEILRFESQNGDWHMKGNVYTAWHEKSKTDYSDGCSVIISLDCPTEEGTAVYENCKEILAYYFRNSYQDICDNDTLWSGFFNEDSAARVYKNDYYDSESDEYDYDRNTISVVLYDSIRPNLYGVFWNGIPLKKDGELLDIDLTVDTYVGYPSCLQ